jgi:hypothetical protein
MILETMAPTGPNPVVESGPLVKARVAHGKTVFAAVPNGEKVWVGSRPVEINGVIVNRDIFTSRQRAYGPGEEVELSQSEVDRLIELGFLVSLDSESKFGKQATIPLPTDTETITPENDPRRQSFAKRPPPPQSGVRTTTSP